MVNVNRYFIKKVAMFAPGLPSKERISSVPVVKDQQVDYVIQEHKAKKAGLHYDFRIALQGKALSWATKKLFPTQPGSSIALFRQPDHTVEYMSFSGTLPEGYGAGSVRVMEKGKVGVVESDPRKIRFVITTKKGNNEYLLINTNSDTWLLKNVSLSKNKGIPDSKPSYKEISPKSIPNSLMSENYYMQPKIDGAHNTFLISPNKPIKVVSYREGRTGTIDHTRRLLGLEDVRGHPELGNIVLRGEIYAEKNRKAIDAARVGGLLNSSIAKSLHAQGSKNIPLKSVIFDVASVGGKDYTNESYDKKLEILKNVESKYPGLFSVPKTVDTSKAKQLLISKIKAGKYGPTKEGMVFWPKGGGLPIKSKFKPDFDVYIRGFFPAGGKFENVGVGGFEYSHERYGPIVGKVGTGFTDNIRIDMYKNPHKYLGRVAVVESQEKFSSGALRAPAYKRLHLDK